MGDACRAADRGASSDASAGTGRRTRAVGWVRRGRRRYAPFAADGGALDV